MTLRVTSVIKLSLYVFFNFPKFVFKYIWNSQEKHAILETIWMTYSFSFTRNANWYQTTVDGASPELVQKFLRHSGGSFRRLAFVSFRNSQVKP